MHQRWSEGLTVLSSILWFSEKSPSVCFSSFRITGWRRQRRCSRTRRSTDLMPLLRSENERILYLFIVVASAVEVRAVLPSVLFNLQRDGFHTLNFPGHWQNSPVTLTAYISTFAAKQRSTFSSFLLINVFTFSDTSFSSRGLNNCGSIWDHFFCMRRSFLFCLRGQERTREHKRHQLDSSSVHLNQNNDTITEYQSCLHPHFVLSALSLLPLTCRRWALWL